MTRFSERLWGTLVEWSRLRQRGGPGVAGPGEVRPVSVSASGFQPGSSAAAGAASSYSPQRLRPLLAPEAPVLGCPPRPGKSSLGVAGVQPWPRLTYPRGKGGASQEKPPKATYKPQQSQLLGNQLGTQSQPKATSKPPQSHPNATPMRHQSVVRACVEVSPGLALLRQADGEFGALVDPTGNGSFAAVGFDDGFDQAQAETQAALGTALVAPVEA